jgi:hypothetical protein
MRGISCLAEELSASHEGLFSMELVCQLYILILFQERPSKQTPQRKMYSVCGAYVIRTYMSWIRDISEVESDSITWVRMRRNIHCLELYIFRCLNLQHKVILTTEASTNYAAGIMLLVKS